MTEDFLRSPSSIGFYSGLLAGITGAVFLLNDNTGFMPFNHSHVSIATYHAVLQTPDTFLLVGLSIFLVTRRVRPLVLAWCALAVLMLVLYAVPVHFIFRYSGDYGREHYLAAQFSVRLWIGAYYGVALALAYGRRELWTSGLRWGLLGSIPWMLVLTIVQLTVVFEIDIDEKLEVLLSCVGIAISGIVQGVVAAIPFQKSKTALYERA